MKNIAVNAVFLSIRRALFARNADTQVEAKHHARRVARVSEAANRRACQCGLYVER